MGSLGPLGGSSQSWDITLRVCRAQHKRLDRQTSVQGLGLQRGAAGVAHRSTGRQPFTPPCTGAGYRARRGRMDGWTDVLGLGFQGPRLCFRLWLPLFFSGSPLSTSCAAGFGFIAATHKVPELRAHTAVEEMQQHSRCEMKHHCVTMSEQSRQQSRHVFHLLL